MKNNGYVVQAREDLYWGEFTHFTRTGLVRHGFSARRGGVSDAPFATLNLGLHTGDSIAAVQENRRLFCGIFDLDARCAVTADQVHGEAIAVVTGEDCGRGALVYETAIPRTDALITNIPGISLMMFYADCVPVYFLDPEHKAIGVAHAGWKGTVAKIGQKTLAMMTKQFGTRPATCLAAVGPSVGPCCYEVDQFVYDKVTDAFAWSKELLRETGPGKWKLDLWRANRQQLEEIGVPAQNIVVAEVCTSCNTDMYFSYRAERGLTGRMAAIMALQ
jgi:YfiH family protein